jgi:hypothetical protein
MTQYSRVTKEVDKGSGDRQKDVKKFDKINFHVAIEPPQS